MQPRIGKLLVCLLASSLCALLLPGNGTVRAAEADSPVEPVPVKHRVTGLFSPDRQEDLRAIMLELPEIKLVSIDYENAEATFLYDAQKVFNNSPPDQLVERFDNLLRGVSHGTFGIRPASATPREKLERVEIKIVGLDCKGCALAAYESVFKIDGVEQATASFKTGLLTALIDPTKTNRAALEDSLTNRNVELKKE